MRPFIFIISCLLINSLAYADGVALKTSSTASPQFMKEQMVEAAKEFQSMTGEPPPGEDVPLDSNSENLGKLSQLAGALSKTVENDSKDVLVSLAAQVDLLKSKVAIEKATLLATQSAKKVRVKGAKTMFNYREDSVYEVLTGVDHITDIQLAPGEQLTNTPMSGDTVRWTLGVMKSGVSPEEIVHIIIKPLEENLETNLIITTDRRVYQLHLLSGDFHMPSAAWNYPEDITQKMQAVLRKEAKEEPMIPVDQLRFTYEIEGKDEPWKPIRVFDDGTKTFIQMPKQMRASEAPALFALDEDDNPMLVNYRVKGDYYIADRLIEKAELRVGEKQKITISLDDGKGFFERLFD